MDILHKRRFSFQLMYTEGHFGGFGNWFSACLRNMKNRVFAEMPILHFAHFLPFF